MRLTVQAQRVLAAFLEDVSQPKYGLQVSDAAGLPSGSVYPILARLEKSGWLASDWEKIDPVSEGRRPRRYYWLTAEGASKARAARDEVRRWLMLPTASPEAI